MNSAPAQPCMLRRKVLRTCLGLAALGLPGVTPAARSRRLYPPVPPAYRAAAQRLAIPPTILYGVALQESSLRWGAHALPWPWTLNIRSEPHRYASYGAALRALDAAIARGVRNVDCGAMQVNWGYHSARLQSPELALNPWHNLAVGASILAEVRLTRAGWFEAVGAYHSPNNAARAHRYARAVFRRIEGIADG